MTRLLVGTLVTRGLAAVGEDASLADADRTLRTMRRTAAAVVRRGRFLGVVLADDLAAARPSAGTTLTFGEVNAALVLTPVTSIIRRDVPTVVPTTPVAEVGRLLRDGATAVPVLEGERVVGIVEVADLLGVLARLDTETPPAQLHNTVINR